MSRHARASSGSAVRGVSTRGVSPLTIPRDTLSVESSFRSPAGRTAKEAAAAGTAADARATQIDLNSHDLIHRLHAKYDAANTALDALQGVRPASPGLSPIHMSSLHSPSDKPKLRFADVDSGCHSNACDHSIHSIRPSGVLPSRPSSVRLSQSPPVTFAAAAATEVRATTRPSDLYSHDTERETFFKLIQQLWEQQIAVYTEQQKRLQQKQPQPQPSHRSSSRSTMTTITSTPNSSILSPGSTASSAHSSPETVADPLKQLSTAGSAPFALWERQVSAWENRLCSWKNAQESILQSRARELESARIDMETAMREQEELYKTRSARFAAAADKMEKERAVWKEQVAKNAERELRLQSLLLERQKELAKKEYRFAQQRKEFDERMAQATTSIGSTSVDSSGALDRLTHSLTRAFEEKEKSLAELYVEKRQKLADEMAQAHAERKAALEHDAEREKECQKRNADLDRRSHELDQRESSMNSNADTITHLQRTIDESVVNHTRALQEVETKWNRRAEEWFAQRDQMQQEILELNRQADQALQAQSEFESTQTVLRGQVDKLHTRLRTSDESLQSARRRIVELEDAIESHKDLTAIIQVKDDKLASLESHLNTMRAQVTTTTSSGHQAAMKSLTSQFEAEIDSIRKQHETELDEIAQGHHAQVQEFEAALVASQKDIAAAHATMETQNTLIDQFQRAMEEQCLRASNADSRIESLNSEVERLSRPTMHEVGTDASELVDDNRARMEGELATANTLLEQKSTLINALREELNVLEHALQTSTSQHEEAMAVAEKSKELLRHSMSVELARVNEEHRLKLAGLEDRWSARLTDEQHALAAKEAALLALDAAHADRIADVERREEVVRNQVERIESSQSNRTDTLIERENDVERGEKELAERMQRFESDAAERESSFATRVSRWTKERDRGDDNWMKRQLDYEHRLTVIEERERCMEESQRKLNDALAQIDASQSTLASDRREFESLRDSHLAAHAASHAAVEGARADAESRLTQLTQDQLALDDDRATLRRQAEELKEMKEEVEEWKQHVQKRDNELTDAIQKFESHMSGRESACTDWEHRLSTVEHKYSLEFTKVTDELQRLSIWEMELMTFQTSLQTRENHLNAVEKNLSEYLAPFNDSNVNNTSGGLDASLLQSPSLNPHLTRAIDQCKLLHTLTTPIMPKKYQSRLTPIPTSQQQLRAATTSALTPQMATPMSIYSPTQAEISILTNQDEHEATPSTN